VKYLIASLLCWWIWHPGFGQNHTEPCGFDYELHARKQTEPGFEAKMFGADRVLKNEILNHRLLSSRADTQVITIPVVFHIMHQLGFENIGDQFIHEEITRLNDAFRNRGPFDQGKGVDIHIEFCLATVDPQGQATNGIERVFSPYSQVLSRRQNYDMRGQYNWDPERYLNIYTASRINFLIGADTVNVIGTAAYPNNAGTGIDAITIRADQIGIANNPLESTVLVHEVGHYLGLYHTYNDGCANYDCMIQGDRVCDTPPDSRGVIFEGCIQNNNCFTDADDTSGQNPFFSDVSDLNNLYLDYNDYSCRNAFTAGQRDRMRAVLRVLRPLLGNNYNCTPRTGSDLALYPLPALTTPVCTSHYVPKIRLFNFGDQTITNFRLNIFLNNGFVFTQFFTRFIEARSSIELLIPAFTLPAGGSEVRVVVDQINGNPSSYADNDTLSWHINYLLPKQPPLLADFENGWPADWTIYNPEGQGFEPMELGCDPSQGDAFGLGLGDHLYYATGVEDGFYTPLADLSNYQRAWLAFDIAYSMEDQVTLFNDRLQISASTDCGLSFDAPVYDKNRYQMQTLNRFSDTVSHWEPTACIHWRRDSIPLHSYAGKEVLLRFIYTKYQNGNPLYLNNIELTGEWGVAISDNFEPLDFGVRLSSDESNIHLSTSRPLDQEASLTGYDLQGREIGKWQFSPSSQSQFILPSPALRGGIYVFKLKYGETFLIRKAILQK
jgi:hypothetical protein